jgi:HSP20 family protein
MFAILRRHPERVVARRNVNPFMNLREEMENLFDRFVEDMRVPEEWVEMRDWEFEELEKEVVMRLELPGFETNEIDLRVEGNVIVARAEHPETTEGNAVRRPAERYEYRFVMPHGTDANHVEAMYRNGVLEVHLPRLPAAEPRRIDVKT